MITHTINSRLNAFLILTSSMIIIFALLGNVHQIKHAWQHKAVTLEYKPIKSFDQTTQQTYSLENYKTMHDDALPKFLVQGKNSNRKNIAVGQVKSKKLEESQIVDHEIFASPNNSRSAKKIFI